MGTENEKGKRANGPGRGRRSFQHHTVHLDTHNSSSGSRNKKQLSFETGLIFGYNLTFHGVSTCAQLLSKNICIYLS